MRVDLLKPIGYCLGVVEAINTSLKVKEEYKDYNVYILGHLVHNENVIDELRKRNIITLEFKKDQFFKILDSFNENDIVIFTAHGHDEKYDQFLMKKGIKFFDTTCEKVKRNMDLIKENLSRGVIYIGKKNHPETVAALSISDDIMFYDIKEKMDFSNVEYYNPIIVNQTTLSFLEIYQIHQDIKKHIPNSEILDEICSSTRIRQENIKNLKGDFDLILIIGSKESSNTDKLFQIAKETHSDIDCYKINNKSDLIDLDLKKYHHVVITSGTSTPYQVIEEVKKYLESI